MGHVVVIHVMMLQVSVFHNVLHSSQESQVHYIENVRDCSKQAWLKRSSALCKGMSCCALLMKSWKLLAYYLLCLTYQSHCTIYVHISKRTQALIAFVGFPNYLVLLY